MRGELDDRLQMRGTSEGKGVRGCMEGWRSLKGRVKRVTPPPLFLVTFFPFLILLQGKQDVKCSCYFGVVFFSLT